MPGILKLEIKALAFDQYGTLVDMPKGWDGKPASFVTWWRRTHFENSMSDALCDRSHTPHQPDLVVADFAGLAARRA
jgi:2-haloacid dehalogenase